MVYYVKQAMERFPMRRPIPSGSLLNKNLKQLDTDPKQPADPPLEPNPDYEKKLKLAAHLHSQGVNPLRWQEAEPATHEAQRRYRATGQVPEEMFVANDRLYRRTPAIAATRAQGQDALDVYLGAVPKKVAELVPVDEVPLRHPLGNRPEKLPDGAAALDRYRRYAALGIDPDSGHDGDAIPPHLQDGLKRAVTDAAGRERPLGIPGVYRNPDDGFFCLAHSGTEERVAVKELRRRLATEKMARTANAEPIAANDNDPEIDEEVAQFYWRERAGQSETRDGNGAKDSPTKSSGNPTQAAVETRARLEELIQAIKQHQKGVTLSSRQAKLLGIVDRSFAQHRLEIDLAAVDTARLRRIMNLQEDSEEEQEAPLSTEEEKIAANAVTRAAAMGSIAEAAHLGRSSMIPARTITTLAADAVKGTVAGAIALPAAVAGLLVAMTKPAGPEHEVIWEALTEAQRIAGKPEFPESTDQGEEVGGAPLSATNDNQPDPANDNNPSRGPNLTATTAATVAAERLGEGIEEPSFTPPEKFDPDSQDMRDFQEDFAYAILQGQLPEIRLNGKLITARNPYGSRGRPIVQQLDEKTAVAVERALERCKGVANVQRLGGGAKDPQFHIGDLDAKGSQNSVRLDLTLGFSHGKYKCFYHINSIDMTKSGRPTLRENRAVERMRSNISKIVERLAEAKDRGLPHANEIGESGYAFDSVRKPSTDDADVNEVIRDFMETVFSCARITRECRRTYPQKG
jgi:hypothetical protein